MYFVYSKVEDDNCQMECADQDDWTICGGEKKVSIFEIKEDYACIHEDNNHDSELSGSDIHVEKVTPGY